ncbi:MAG TPA: protein-disulfide reductase DsbD domain-containing protein, partial [Candidatus Udaeobacter sp.]|nr:protein-disulfide reductase DsbD domain-containing protein [Candidatus Udaeobacter sp.]
MVLALALAFLGAGRAFADPIGFDLGTHAAGDAPTKVGSRGGSDNVEVELLSDVASIQPGKQFLVALRMKLDSGWHTYWKNPGDSGLPLKIQWELPPGFTPGEIQWPIPSRIPEPPLLGYGYHGDVLFTVPIMPAKSMAAHDARIAATFDWLECEDICIPGTAKLAITLPIENASRPGPSAGLIAAGQGALPTTSLGWDLSARSGREIVLTAKPPQGLAFTALEFYPSEGLVIESSAPQRLESSGGRYTLTMTPDPNAEGKPERLTGVLVHTGAGGARTGVTIDVPVTGTASAAGTTGASGWP